MKDWKTTTLGVLSLIVGVASLLQKLLSGEPVGLDELTAIGSGGALVWAKDR